MIAWGSKAWDGCLQARAINVLQSTCVSDYYHYYHYYYYYYYYYSIIIIIIIIIGCCCCCYTSIQASSKRALIGLSYVAPAGQII